MVLMTSGGFKASCSKGVMITWLKAAWMTRSMKLRSLWPSTLALRESAGVRAVFLTTVGVRHGVVKIYTKSTCSPRPASVSSYLFNSKEQGFKTTPQMRVPLTPALSQR